jgi:large subunit ribosomal protein L3
MLNSIFATKRGMSQVWTKQGKRMPVTKCMVDDNIVIGQQKRTAINRHSTNFKTQPCVIFEIGYGKKKIKNTPKPLSEKIKQSGFSFGVRQVRGLKHFIETGNEDQELTTKVGSTLELAEILSVGDVVKVQGTTKGKGFAGVIKRHGMHGGPRTHGQSDRERAVGSIGAMTDPGRVWKGKKMPGHMGNETKTVSNLVVIHIDPETKEVWLNGPVPGHWGSILRITKTGGHKDIDLNKQAAGIEVKDNSNQEIKAKKEVAKGDSPVTANKEKSEKK